MFADMAMIAVIVVYIVDVSGFTDSWRNGLARILGVRSLRPLPPFDCGQCMTFWACIIYAFVAHRFGIGAVALSVMLSHLSGAIGQALILLRESLMVLIAKLLNRL